MSSVPVCPGNHLYSLGVLGGTKESVSRIPLSERYYLFHLPNHADILVYLFSTIVLRFPSRCTSGTRLQIRETASVQIVSDWKGSGRRRLTRLSAFDGGDSRLCAALRSASAALRGIGGEVHLGSSLDELGLAGSLEEGESRAILPSLRSP